MGHSSLTKRFGEISASYLACITITIYPYPLFLEYIAVIKYPEKTI